MHRNIVPWLKVAVCGVVLCGYLALLSTLMYPVAILIPVILAMAGMPFGERLNLNHPEYTQVTTGLSILALAGIVMMGPEIGALNMVIGLMMLVQVHALLHVKRQRHYSYLLLMSFSQVMAASMMSPSPEIGLVYLVLIVFTIWTLVLLDIFRGTEELGAVYVRGSLDYETRNGALQESGSRSFRRSMTWWIAGLALASILVSGGLFLVIPRTEAGAFGSQDIFPVQEDTTTGLSSGIDLRTSGRITEDRTAVMSATFPELPEGRYTGRMYWGVTTFDKYRGEGWSRQGLESRSVVIFRRSARFAAHPEGSRGSDEGVYRADYASKHTVEYEVFLTRMPEEGVPVLSLPLMVQPMTSDPGVWSWDMSGDFTVHHRHRGESGIAYRGVSVVSESRPEELRTSRVDFRDLMNPTDYRLLTEQNLLPETVELVENLTTDASNVYDRLMALQRQLSTDAYRYSLDVPELPGNNPIDAFILDVRTGHCQLFASAMALMARSEGIPSRLVSGYRGGNYDADTQSYTVTANMAHVWVEVFLPDFGWTIFDPSPPLDAPPTFSFGTFQSAYSTFVLRLKLLWLRQVVGYNAGESGTILGRDTDVAVGQEAAVVEKRSVAVVRTVAENLQLMVFGVVFLTGVASAALVLRSRFASRRMLAGLDGGQVRAVSLYRQLQKRLTKLGVTCAGKTAEELVEEASHLERSLGDRVAHVVSVYNGARFGTRALAPEQFLALKREISGFRVNVQR